MYLNTDKHKKLKFFRQIIKHVFKNQLFTDSSIIHFTFRQERLSQVIQLTCEGNFLRSTRITYDKVLCY